jgi:hypothetical protein
MLSWIGRLRQSGVGLGLCDRFVFFFMLDTHGVYGWEYPLHALCVVMDTFVFRWSRHLALGLGRQCKDCVAVQQIRDCYIFIFITVVLRQESLQFQSTSSYGYQVHF